MYSHAAGSPYNIAGKICQNNSATSPLIYPQSRRIFVVRKKRKKRPHGFLWRPHWCTYRTVNIFRVSVYSIQTRKRHFWVHPPFYPRKWPLCKKLRYKFEVHSIVNKATLVSFLYIRSKYVYFCKQKRFALTSYVSLMYIENL